MAVAAVLLVVVAMVVVLGVVVARIWNKGVGAGVEASGEEVVGVAGVERGLGVFGGTKGREGERGRTRMRMKLKVVWTSPVLLLIIMIVFVPSG